MLPRIADDKFRNERSHNIFAQFASYLVTVHNSHPAPLLPFTFCTASIFSKLQTGSSLDYPDIFTRPFIAK